MCILLRRRSLWYILPRANVHRHNNAAAVAWVAQTATGGATMQNEG